MMPIGAVRGVSTALYPVKVHTYCCLARWVSCLLGNEVVVKE
jgi:hypothetical protein